MFSNLKRWALGTFHGLRRAHLRRYLDEFVFRWNRRRHTAIPAGLVIYVVRQAFMPKKEDKSEELILN